MYFPGHHLYLGSRVVANSVSHFIQEYFSFLILYNNIIPISLYVTIELHKFLGSFFMEWDRDLYDIETNQCCVVNTSDLNEELGQVKLLFSDKTGTLTKNEMILQQCSINGKKYHVCDGGIQESGRPNTIHLGNYRDDVRQFFQALAVCHTVQVAGSETLSMSQQREEAAIEASFVMISDTDLSSNGEEDTESWNTNSSHRPSTSTNAEYNADFVSSINNLNDPNEMISTSNSNGANTNDVQPEQRRISGNLVKNDEQSPHKRTSSNAPRISFNIDNRIYPTYSRSVSMEPPRTLPRPTSLAALPTAVTTPSFQRKHMPKVESPLAIKHPLDFDEVTAERMRPPHLVHRRTQSASVATARSKPTTQIPATLPGSKY